MSQGLREMLANRKFAIPLIALLALCLIGLFMIGIVIIFQPGKSGDQVAQTGNSIMGDPLAMGVDDLAALPTDTLEPTEAPSPTATVTPRPTATLVPVGTVASQPAATVADMPTVESVAEVQPTAAATATSAQPVAQATTDPGVTDNELADTGLGWGLILVSGVGLAGLALIARRLRLAN